jgi:hypothetical protein
MKIWGFAYKDRKNGKRGGAFFGRFNMELFDTNDRRIKGFT